MNVERIGKEYIKNNTKIVGIKNFTYNFEKGKLYAIKGKSGSGKTTLIKLLGLMENKTSGRYVLDGEEIDCFTDDELSNIRMRKIGFVFQDYWLNKNLTALENIVLPMMINKDIQPKFREERAIKLLEIVGLVNRLKHFPKELSGGEQQRICIARAIANDPDYLLCDEPTGNLDKEFEEQIFKLLKMISRKNKCVIVVTHSNEIDKFADKIIHINNGEVVLDEVKR